MDHSTPEGAAGTEIAAQSSHNQLKNKNSNSAPGAMLTAPPLPIIVHRSDSQNTAVTNVSASSSEGEVPRQDNNNHCSSATNIFAQIHSLNVATDDEESGNELERAGDNRGLEQDECSGEGSGSDMAGNVSEMALLSHAEPPDMTSSGGGVNHGGRTGGASSATFY